MLVAGFEDLVGLFYDRPIAGDIVLFEVPFVLTVLGPGFGRCSYRSLE